MTPVAITFIDSSIDSAANPTITTLTVTLTVPAGANPGDVLVVLTKATAVPTPAETGWTSVASTSSSSAVFYRTVASGDPTSYDFQAADVKVLVGILAAYTGTAGVNASAMNVGATSPSQSASVTTTETYCLLVGLFGASLSQTTTLNVSLDGSTTTRQTETATSGSGSSGLVAVGIIGDRIQATAGSGTISATWSASVDGSNYLLALAPARGTVTGTIIDADTGLPIEGAMVSLNDPDNSSAITNVIANG